MSSSFKNYYISKSESNLSASLYNNPQLHPHYSSYYQNRKQLSPANNSHFQTFSSSEDDDPTLQQLNLQNQHSSLALAFSSNETNMLQFPPNKSEDEARLSHSSEHDLNVNANTNTGNSNYVKLNFLSSSSAINNVINEKRKNSEDTSTNIPQVYKNSLLNCNLIPNNTKSKSDKSPPLALDKNSIAASPGSYSTTTSFASSSSFMLSYGASPPQQAQIQQQNSSLEKSPPQNAQSLQALDNATLNHLNSEFASYSFSNISLQSFSPPINKEPIHLNKSEIQGFKSFFSCPSLELNNPPLNTAKTTTNTTNYTPAHVTESHTGTNNADGISQPFNWLRALTVNLISTFHFCDGKFVYEEKHNPKRVLTKPFKRVYNDGFDNENHDYILYVNDIFGNEDSRKFIILDLLGHGTFGQVIKCQNIKTKEIVAIKIIKNQVAYFNQSMMEVTILELLNQKFDANDIYHITRMKDTFIYKKHLCIVFELLSLNLFELIKQNHFKGFSHQLIRIFLNQILQALCLLNDAKIVHCDLKPENILLKNMDSPEIKVIDFGSACHEKRTIYTYIQSRFYRSPEVLLGLPYSSSIDVWSLGCIAAELFLGLPLFPGSSNYDQVYRITECIGLPPLHMIEVGKNSKLYFEKTSNFSLSNSCCAGNSSRSNTSNSSMADSPASSSGGSEGSGKNSETKPYPYKLKTREQYSQENNSQEKPSKKYFTGTKLEDVIKKYPFKSSSMTPKEIEIEKQNRIALIDLLKGILQLNPIERWSPQQAKLHPYLTGEPWLGPYVPNGSYYAMPLYKSCSSQVSSPCTAGSNISVGSNKAFAITDASDLSPGFHNYKCSPVSSSHTTPSLSESGTAGYSKALPSGSYVPLTSGYKLKPGLFDEQEMVPKKRFQRPRASTINSQLSDIPPQIQKLAAVIKTHGACPPGGFPSHIYQHQSEFLERSERKGSISSSYYEEKKASDIHKTETELPSSEQGSSLFVNNADAYLNRSEESEGFFESLSLQQNMEGYQRKDYYLDKKPTYNPLSFGNSGQRLPYNPYDNRNHYNSSSSSSNFNYGGRSNSGFDNHLMTADPEPIPQLNIENLNTGKSPSSHSKCTNLFSDYNLLLNNGFNNNRNQIYTDITHSVQQRRTSNPVTFNYFPSSLSNNTNSNNNSYATNTNYFIQKSSYTNKPIKGPTDESMSPVTSGPENESYLSNFFQKPDKFANEKYSHHSFGSGHLNFLEGEGSLLSANRQQRLDNNNNKSGHYTFPELPSNYSQYKTNGMGLSPLRLSYTTQSPSLLNNKNTGYMSHSGNFPPQPPHSRAEPYQKTMSLNTPRKFSTPGSGGSTSDDKESPLDSPIYRRDSKEINQCF